MTGKEKLYWKMNEARELIAMGHCKGTSAEDIYENQCNLYSDRAARFCILGAQQRVMPKDIDMRAESYKQLFNASDLTADDNGILSVRGQLMNFNDAPETTTEDVLALFDRAMDELKKEIESNAKRQ